MPYRVAMANWWSRLGQVLGLASGVGYLTGAVAVSEFGRVFGVAAGTIGVSATDYVAMAAIAVLTLAYLSAAVTVLLVALADIAVTSFNTDGRVYRSGLLQVVVGSARVLGKVPGMFTLGLFYGALVVVPVALLAGNYAPATLVFLIGATVIAGVFVSLVWLPAARAHAAVAASTTLTGAAAGEGHSAGSGFLLEWCGSHGLRSLTVAATVVLVSVVSSGVIAHGYGQRILDLSADKNEDIPRPPVLLAMVISPAWVCPSAQTPNAETSSAVIRVTDVGDTALLADDGDVVLLIGGERRYVSCAPQP